MHTKRLFTLLFLAFMVLNIFQAKATTYQFNSAFGNWSNSAYWLPVGVPGVGDTVIMNVSGSTLILDIDVTVNTMIIENLSQISGSIDGSTTHTLTITNRLLSKFSPLIGCNIVIGQNATATLNNQNFSAPYAGINIYADLIINGTMEADMEFLAATRMIINGTLTHRKGPLGGEITVNPGAVLNLNSPTKLVDLGRLLNKGTFNWQAGDISAYSDIRNEGTWNISSNASLVNEELFQNSPIENVGVIRVNAAVTDLLLNKRLNNEGSIELLGPTRLGLLALLNKSSISGPAGSTVELSGYYFSTGNKLEANSSLNVDTLRTKYLTELNIRPGANINTIKYFDFDAGPVQLGLVLPPAVRYRINAQVVLENDQSFTGQVEIGGGFDGPYTVTFNTTEARWTNATFSNNLTEITATAVVEMKNAQVRSLLNNGTLNWTESGNMQVGEPGIVNNGTFNVSAAKAIINGSSMGTTANNFMNNGIFNYNYPIGGGVLEAYNCGLTNENEINVGAADTLRWAGPLVQKDRLLGQSGSQLEMYASVLAQFVNGSETSGFERFFGNIAYDIRFEAGANFPNIPNFLLKDSKIESRIVLPPNANYSFNSTLLRLTTAFQPNTPLLMRNSTVEGSGSVKIVNALDWQGGTFDVPLRIDEGATASIRETLEQRPIISSPFTNSGEVTLSGGIIEINTGFFVNKGTWQVDSEEDVIIDGFSPFGNDGTLAICGNQPIQIIFNVPFTNAANGTFKGQGSYTFNAGYINNGTVAPGCSPGRLDINSDFETGAGIDVEIESEANGAYDFFYINGDLELNGTLRVLVPNGAAPAGAIKVIETAGTINGTFSNVEMPPGYTLTYTENAVFVNATGLVSAPDLTTAGGWQVTPTLATDWLRVSTDRPLKSDLVLNIVDVQGRVVFTSVLNVQSDVLEVAVNTLQPGMYYVRGNNGLSARFVKM